ncbi:MAG: SRPBCC family protein [Pseudomonadota bacterium]
MFKTISLIVLLLLIALLAYAATRPGTFRVERSIVVQAAPEKIHPLIDDFHQWQAWSPYEKLDPAMTRSYSGSAHGQGAAYEWSSEGKAGAGRMEILSSTAPKTTIQLDFSKPFKANNTAEFTLVPQGAGTQVTWAMYGASPFVAKLMGLFFDMDKLVGKDFDAGLASLKAAAEK